ncbi:MAG: MFS transporter, partial [Burkholderiaceae bacterium]
MLGPGVGGLLTEWMSWRYIFVLLAALATATIILTWRYMPETAQVSIHQKPRLIPSAIVLARLLSYRAYTFVLIFATGIYWAFQAGAPYLIMEVMRRSPAEYGMYFFFTAIGYASGNFLSGRYSERAGTDRMLLLALIPLALGIILFWVFADTLHPMALFGPMFLLTISNGMTVPSATAGALSARPELAGTAAGLTGFLQIGIGALITLLVGFIQNGFFWPLLTVVTVCGLLSTGGVVSGRRKNPD